MRLRISLSSRRGFFVILTGVVLMTGVLGHQVWGAFEAAEQGAPFLESYKLREGIIALVEVEKLSEQVRDAVDRGAISPKRRHAIEAANDHLFLRVQALERLLSEGVVAREPEYLAPMREVQQTADRLLAASPADVGRTFRSFVAKVAWARQALVGFTDRQLQAKATATERQTDLLRRMTFSAGALLGLFAFLAFTAMHLLRREVQASRALTEAQDRLNFLAYYDPLTGTSNRTHFRQRAELALRDTPGGIVILVDLDAFKAVNDTYGHAVGDHLLRVIASRLRRQLQPLGGFAGRLGGDEFAGFLPGPLDRPALERFCTALLATLRGPVKADGRDIIPRACLGLASAADIAPGADTSLGGLMKAADVALYKAKETGRDRFCFFDQALARQVEWRRQIVDSIPAALAADEFVLHFQPQVELRGGRIIGVEALIRWQRGDTVLAPSEFLPVAEDSRQILDLDRWCLRTATRAIAELRRATGTDIAVSVNLSSLHFRAPAILQDVRAALAASALPPDCLTLEVTETLLIEDWDNLDNLLRALRGLGVRLSLDDFGTGYSSLAYLQRMEVDELKIDRSFVTDIESSNQRRFMLDAIVDIARGFGMRLVVEGVETESQARILEDLGCAIGQGYLFGRPMALDTLRTRLHATPGRAAAG